MKIYFLLTAFIFCLVTVQSQQLVKDINTTIGSLEKLAGIVGFTVAGDKTYFVANDQSSGYEPWVTDGTAAGTHLLRDINPGKVSSDAGEFTYCNGYIYFRADDGSHGYELWKTDGTATGTVMVKDINTGYTTSGGPNGSGPRNLCEVNGVLYFVANNDPSLLDYALWKTDGTAAGTVLVNNMNIWNAFNIGSAESLTSFNGMLYYTEAVNNVPAMYRVTPAGVTELVQTINASRLTVIGSTLYYSGQLAASGAELWKIESGVTSIVKDIYPGTSSSGPDQLTDVNGILFFTAWDGVNGTELWKSDGTEAGTIMVKDITTANNISTNKPTQLTNVNGILFFNGYTVANNKELWKSDGTESGTMMVKDIVPGSSSPGGNPVNMINNNGTLLFVSGVGDLWKSDGTEAGTVLVKDLNNCLTSSNVPALPGNIVFYGAPVGTGNGNLELWISDGTAAGTMQLKNIAIDNPESLVEISGYPRVAQRFAHANGQLFAAAKNSNSPKSYSLYSTLGTEVTTIKLNEYLDVGAGNPFPNDAANIGGKIYFGFSNTANGNELWKSDGTIAGTGIVKDIQAGTGSSVPENMTNVNGTIFFSASDGTTGTELWKSDGTAAGTILVKDINTGAASSIPEQLTNVNGTLFFTAITNAAGRELWKSDGTAAGTVLVKDINPGTSSAFSNVAGGGISNYLTVMGNELYFAATASSTQGKELWKSDGTAIGTVLVKDIITSSTQSGDPRFLTVVGNQLFFTADDYGFGDNSELWVSNGTTLGTQKVKEINAGNDPSSPSNLIVLNGLVYFSAYEPATGYELWKSDGTAAGTILVKDIEPGVLSGMQAGKEVGAGGVPFRDITKANGFIYFPAATAAEGRELWRSDGTAAGTTLVGDVFPGPQSSSPEQVTNADGVIYFVGENGSSGKELYSFNPNPFFVLPPVTVEDSADVDWQNHILVGGTNQVIATIKQTGIKPVNGLVKTKLTIGASPINYNGRTLARKHVDIEPSVNPSTSSATITLYFSQADFDTYNSDDNINGDLPANPLDVDGKAALRIIQYHGVGTAPGNYPGPEEIINPSDDSITWNAAASYWEVSFTVTGFSGFYLSSVPTVVLPVKLVSFNGYLNAQRNVSLQWKVVEQQDIVSYEIERSSNAVDFTTIGNVKANTQNYFTYNYEDIAAPSTKSFYRIKIIDHNGRITYSNIIVINPQSNSNVYLYATPDRLTINVKGNAYQNSTVNIIDNTGRLMQQVFINNTAQAADISRLAAGIYYVQFNDGTVLKFKK